MDVTHSLRSEISLMWRLGEMQRNKAAVSNTIFFSSVSSFDKTIASPKQPQFTTGLAIYIYIVRAVIIAINTAMTKVVSRRLIPKSRFMPSIVSVVARAMATNCNKSELSSKCRSKWAKYALSLMHIPIGSTAFTKPENRNVPDSKMMLVRTNQKTTIESSFFIRLSLPPQS